MGPAHKRLLKQYAPVGVAERDQEEKPRGAIRAQEAQEREAAGEEVRVELPRWPEREHHHVLSGQDTGRG